MFKDAYGNNTPVLPNQQANPSLGSKLTSLGAMNF